MKTILVILFSVASISFVSGQIDSTDSKYALSFGIGDNFTLRNFNMDIAAKKIVDSKHQIRLFLSPYISTGDTKNDNTSQQLVESSSQNYSLGIGADYLWILLNKNDINMFGGTGLAFFYGHNSAKKTTTLSDGNMNITESNQPSIQVRLRGTLGVEWMVSRSVGIHSEYLMTGSYIWSRSKNKTTSTNINIITQTSKTTKIGLSTSVLFGLSIYL